MSAASPDNPYLKMILDHFPDAVDIVFSSSKETTEHLPNVFVDVDGDIVDLQLKELEPETGIYATMSHISHRVYVFVDPVEHF